MVLLTMFILRTDAPAHEIAHAISKITLTRDARPGDLVARPLLRHVHEERYGITQGEFAAELSISSVKLMSVE
jgi:hypothetical protein